MSGGQPAAGTAARRARRQAASAGGDGTTTTSGSGGQPGGSGPGRRPGRDPGTGAKAAGPAGATGSRSNWRFLDPDALAALEEERDFLLRSLADLEREHEAGDVDDVDFAELQDDYTARAAEVLRAIESRQAAMAAGRRRPEPFRRAVSIALVVLLAVLAGVIVGQSSGRRGAGDQITGDIRQSARDMVLDARREMGEGNYLEAINTFDEVVGLQPSNVEARAYKGWLLVLVARDAPAGPDRDLLRKRALDSLNSAVEIDPEYPDARVFRAMALRTVGQPAAGLADLDTLEEGDIPFDMREMVAGLRTSLQEEVAGAPAADGPAPDAPADDGPAPDAPAPPG